MVKINLEELWLVTQYAEDCDEWRRRLSRRILIAAFTKIRK